MDLLVMLCASYHLNPSDYTVEVLSPNKNNISFKPNSPIGSLEAEKIVLKPRGVEEKIRKPYMPEVKIDSNLQLDSSDFISQASTSCRSILHVFTKIKFLDISFTGVFGKDCTHNLHYCTRCTSKPWIANIYPWSLASC